MARPLNETPREGYRLLVLRLKREDKIMIGDDIEVQLLSVRGGQVRVGFTAPKAVTVDRLKVWQRRRATAPRRKSA